MLVKTLFNRMEKFKSFVFSKAWIDDSKGKVRIVLEPNRSFPPRRDPSRKKVMTTETSGVWEKFMKVSCFRSRREESGQRVSKGEIRIRGKKVGSMGFKPEETGMKGGRK